MPKTEDPSILMPVELSFDAFLGTAAEQVEEKTLCDLVIRMAGLFHDVKYIDEITSFYTRVGAIHREAVLDK